MSSNNRDKVPGAWRREAAMPSPYSTDAAAVPDLTPITVVRDERGRFATFAPAAVKKMAELLPTQSKDTVSAVLGISSNTWLKIKRGEPIRASTAYGLSRRLALMPAQRPGTSPR